MDTGPLNSEDLYRQNLNHTLLDAGQEKDFLTRARQGDRTAIDQLVQNNQRLVMSFALRYHRSSLAGDHDLMDLIQFGNIGLLEAVSRWDGSRTTRFSTYATWWIRAVIRRGAMTSGSSHTQSAREGELLFAIRKAISRLVNDLHRQPTPEEISADSGISLALVNQLIPMLRQCLRLDADYGSDRWFGEVVPSPILTPELEYETREQLERLSRGLNHLPTRYAQVLVLHYGLAGSPALSFTEIARRFSVSRTRIQEIEKLALRKLREFLT